MSNNSNETDGSDSTINSQLDDQTEKKRKLEHTGNKSQKKTSETKVVKISLEEKISEALKSVSPSKEQTQKKLTIKYIPLDVKASKDNTTYYSITTQVIEDNTILKTIVTPIQKTYQRQVFEKPRTSLSKNFLKYCSHIKLCLGAISPSYRPRLAIYKHKKPMLRKASSLKDLKTGAENLKINQIAERQTKPVSKTPFSKLIYGAITSSNAAIKPQVSTIIKETDKVQNSEVKMEQKERNGIRYSPALYRPKLYKKHKHATPMKIRNEKALKMREKLLKLLLQLRNTTEETENVIKVFCQQEDIKHLQKFVNTQLNKSITQYEYAHIRSLESLENQNAAHLSAETKKLKEAKENEQKVDTDSKSRSQLGVNVDNKHADATNDAQIQTFIRRSKELSTQSKSSQIISTESKNKKFSTKREMLSPREQKPIKIILQKIETRTGRIKLWNNNNTYASQKNNGPQVNQSKEESKKNITALKAQKTNTNNKTKMGSSMKISTEKTQHSPLVHAKDQKEKPVKETRRTKTVEPIQTIKNASKSSVWSQTSQVKENKPKSSKPKISQRGSTSSYSFPPKASAEGVHDIGKQDTKLNKYKGQDDQIKSENAATRSNQEEQKIHQKVSIAQKTPTIKRERLRLSRTIRQTGKTALYCKSRPTLNEMNTNKSSESRKLKETKANRSLASSSTDKSKSKKAEKHKIRQCMSQENKKSSIETPMPKKQNAELLNSKSTTTAEIPNKSKASKENSNNNKNEDLKSLQDERNAMKSKSDVYKKKAIINRAAAKAELKEIELQRKQELQALKDRLTRPKTASPKNDTYYEYLLGKLEEISRKGQLQTYKTKAPSFQIKRNQTTTTNKRAKSNSSISKLKTGRQKLDRYKSKVLSEKKINQYFKCSGSSKSCSQPEVTPMPKYGCHRTCLTYTDLQSIGKMKSDGSFCKKLPQKTESLKKCSDSKPALKEVKCAILNPIAKKDGENGNQKTSRKITCIKHKASETECADEKTKTESERKNETNIKGSCASKPKLKEVKYTAVLKPLSEKAGENSNNGNITSGENKASEVQCTDKRIKCEPERKSEIKPTAKTVKPCKSTQHKNLLPDKLHPELQKESLEAFKIQQKSKAKANLKDPNERVKELYSFKATSSENQTVIEERRYNPKQSVKEITILKGSLCAGMKHKWQLQKSLQNKLKRLQESAKNHRAEDIKAKQAIKKALLINVHEALKINNIKDGFRNNVKWNILIKGIKNSINETQLVNVVKETANSLKTGIKNSINSKELQLAFKEGVKHRELLSVVRQSINIPLLLKSLISAMKEYTKLKYKTLKKIQEESNKKNGGGNSGTSSAVKSTSGDSSNNCNKQKNVKREASAPNKSKILYQLSNIISKQTPNLPPSLMKDIRKLVLDSLAAFPQKTTEHFQLSKLHKYTRIRTSVSHIESRPVHKNFNTANKLVPFVFKSSNFMSDEETKLVRQNPNQDNVSRASSKELTFSQSLQITANQSTKITVRDQTNKDRYLKQHTLKQMNAMNESVYKVERNAFASDLSKRLSLNQILRDFFNPNEHFPSDRKSELNKTAVQNSTEEVLRKLICDNMHTVNKTPISENSIHTASSALKEKILTFFLKHDMIYVTGDISKHVTQQITDNTSNEPKVISANTQEIRNYLHTDMESKSPRGTSETTHADKGSSDLNETNIEEKSKLEVGKPEAKSEHATAEKLSIQHASNQPQLSGLAKHFNSETITGRANVAKATLTCIALGYLYYRSHKRSNSGKDGKSSK